VAAAARKEAGGEERAKVEGRGNARGSAVWHAEADFLSRKTGLGVKV
jgi:hypothetical protein